MAKRFQFRLQGVLNYRKQVEDDRARRLAEAKGVLLQVEEAMKQNATARDGAGDEFSELKRSGSMSVDEMVAHNQYWTGLLNREARLKGLEREVEREVEKRRLGAVEASRERRLLDNLKERKRAAHQAEEAREEQGFLDEHAAIAFVRRDRDGEQGAVDESLGR